MKRLSVEMIGRSLSRAGLAVALLCLFQSLGLFAAPLYWDSNGATPYAGGPTPTGTWGTDAFWSGSAQGNTATGAYVSGSDVVFAAGADATGAYTVTLTGTQTASTVTFGEGHVTLSGGTLALTGGSITTQMDSTISSTISAASGYTKNGPGSLTLTANYTGGAITVNGGTLILGTGIGGDGFAPNPRSITINAGATLRYVAVNPVQNLTVFTINSGGTLDLNGSNDAVGNFSGTGLISLGSGTFTMDIGSTNTFSGIITGTGGLTIRSANTGGGLLVLAGANTYSGGTSLSASSATAGGLQAAHKRALQNSTVSLTNTTGTGLTFASGIGTFILGGLSGSTGLSLTDTNSTAITLQVGNNNASTSYTGVLSGSGALTKIGTGTLTLTNANTYTGDTTVAAGTANSTSSNPANPSTLKLDFNAAGAPAANIINGSSRLVLAGGQLQMAGSSTVAVSQTVNGTQLNGGFSQVGVTANASANNTVLNLGVLTRSAGGLVNFTLPTGTQSALHGITTTTNANANGILGAWATLGNDWATVTNNGTNNNIAAYTGYTLQAGTVIANSATTNLKIDSTSADPLTLGSTVVDVSTIQITDTAARNLTVAAGQTLRVAADGGIWRIGGGSTLRFVIGASANTGVLTAGGADNTAGELLLNAGGGITVNSKITDNGTGVVTLVKTGASDLFLNGSNAYTGGTVIVQGRVNVNTATALGTGTVTIQPGGQAFLGGLTVTNNFVIAGTGWGETAGPGAIRMSNGTTIAAASTITLAGDARIGGNNVAGSTIAAKITGDYALEFANGSSSSLASFTLSNTANDFGGNLNINGTFNNGLITVKLGASNVVPNGAGKGNVLIQGGATAGNNATLDLNGFAETINGLVSGGTAAQTAVTNSSTTANAVLTLGDADTTATFAGVIKDGASRNIGITKIGLGVQTLSGANTYTGATTINAGSLKAGAANTFSAGSAVILSNTAGANLDLNNFDQTIGSLAGGGSLGGYVNLGTAVGTNGTLTTGGDNSSTTYAGTILGGGNVIKTGTGTFTLTGANSYSGATTVSSGNLQVGAGGVGQTGTGAVTVNGAGAVLSGTGSVMGATAITNGTVKPGDSGGSSIGSLMFADLSSNSLTLAGGTTGANPRALFTLSGATGNEANPLDGIQTTSLLTGAPGNHDYINILGTFNITSGSTIQVQLSGYTPVFGDVFNLLDWASINSGTFDPQVSTDLDLTGASLSPGLAWDTSQFLTSGVIFVTPEPSRTLLSVAALFAVLLRRRRTSAPAGLRNILG